MIDAQVNPVFAIEEMSFYEVQDAMTFADHLPFIATVVSSPGFVDGLSEARRSMLQDVLTELDADVAEVVADLNEKGLETIREAGGTEIVHLDESERAVFRELSLPVRDTYVELAGPRGARILETLLEEVEKAESSARDGEGTGGS
jgi:TRAP-type C4-dicarboxylate transport system substrate-binding protein